MALDEIEQLVDLVARSGVSEVTLRTEGKRITIRKTPVAPRPAARTGGPTAAASVAEAAQAAATAAEAQRAAEVVVSAPMVGIFHHAEPPVGPGTVVEPGQVVGVIESMKLMNDVRAERGGTVRDVLVEAGMAVEYGQPLFALAG